MEETQNTINYVIHVNITWPNIYFEKSLKKEIAIHAQQNQKKTNTQLKRFSDLKKKAHFAKITPK